MSSKNNISTPERGWRANEIGELEIEYFFGSPYPEVITAMPCADDSDKEDEVQISSDDEKESDGDSSDDDDWNPNK